MTLSPGDAANAVVLTVDENLALRSSLTTFGFTLLPPSADSLRVQLGLIGETGTAPLPAWKIHFDDVTADLR